MARAKSKHAFGVYRIYNKLTKDCYIGSTSSRGFVKRFSDHRCDLRQQRHVNQILQRAWNKYGEKAFVFECILICAPEHCIMYEQTLMNTLGPRYNINPVAGSRLGATLSEASKQLIRDANLGKTYSDEVNAKKGRVRVKSLEERAKISASLRQYRGVMQQRTAKLSIENVKLIKQLILDGWRNKELAERFGITPHTVSAIRHQKTWSNIHV